ncbi:MAG: ATP-binding protein [Candidatus Binatia bacterium]
MMRRWTRFEVALGSTFIGLLFAIVAGNSLRWIGTTFPGFFVMANRVVPSISLPSWEAGNCSRFFQSQVLAVDGRPVSSAQAVYDAARMAPPGTRLTYTLRKPDGEVMSAAVASRTFSGSDLAFIQGALALNGLAFAAIGLIVLYLKPSRAATYGLLSACLSTGTFAITAADLYGPHWFFRLHILGETFMAPGFIHLALVFPTDRLRRQRWRALARLYTPFVVLAVFYEWALSRPSAYTAAHLIATALHGAAVLVIVICFVREFFGTSSALIRRRLGVVGLGIVSGVVLPGTLMAASAVLGGRVPVNAGTLTAFFFPLSLGYAIVQQDLFEIDVMLRRAVTYVIVLITVTAAYLVALFVIGLFLPARHLWAQSPAGGAVLNLGLLFVVAPTRKRVQYGVDRIFFRTAYDAEQALSELSQQLAAARAIDDVIAYVLRVLAETLSPSHAAIALHEGAGRFTHVGGRIMSEITVPADLAERVARGEVLASYEWDDGTGRPMPMLWRQIDAEIIVPIHNSSTLVAILVLGTKQSGHAYTPHDVLFLRTLANQAVLAMTNATAFGKLEELNVSLEQQVRDRTAALSSTNVELQCYIEKFRHAYELLERNQASLLRADRLATLGRLAAGLAHEINTPLGAVLNSLKIVVDLTREYADSIEDPNVLPDDHRQIAAEIAGAAEAATTWARKAAAFLSRTKLQGRELHPAVCQPFAARSVVDETRELLRHRLRAADCAIEYSEAPEGIELLGDPSRLGQVLVNLVANAVDAYEDTGFAGGKIEIKALRTNGCVTLTVRDWAGGIPSEVLPHIFDELFTTKEPGKGTGLGLWIARNLVEESFGGQLTADSAAPVGSCFTVSLPVKAACTAAISSSAVPDTSVLNAR